MTSSHPHPDLMSSPSMTPEPSIIGCGPRVREMKGMTTPSTEAPGNTGSFTLDYRPTNLAWKWTTMLSGVYFNRPGQLNPGGDGMAFRPIRTYFTRLDCYPDDRIPDIIAKKIQIAN